MELTLIDFAVLADKDISAHYRRPVEEGEIEDSKQSIWKIHMPGDDTSTLDPKLKEVAEELWTEDVILAYKTKWGIQ